MAGFVTKPNFAPIKNVLVKIVHIEWDAPCFPEFKSFGILILSITVWRARPFKYHKIGIFQNAETSKFIQNGRLICINLV